MANELDALNERVSDIEHCIGDFQEIFASLQAALALRLGPGGPGPLCPPYCAHGTNEDYADPLTLEARVTDIRKCIGDFAEVFATLAESLGSRPGPLCPPYCAHPINGSQSQS
jgi:hypothetical protein